MRSVKKTSTDQSVVIRIIDSTDGTPENAVEHNTAGIDLWYRREGAVKISITEVALAALDSAHLDGGIELIGDGYYRLDPPDAAFAAGANGVMIGGTVTGMIVMGCYIPLVDYDPYDTVRLGLTSLPDAAADAAGGLPISDAGGLALDTKLANTNEITVARMDALTDWIDGGRLDLLLDACNTTTPPTAVANAIAVWDRILSGATHNIATSAGRRVREMAAFAIHGGTAQSGNATSITLAAGASANDGVYNRNLVAITEGTGTGQTRQIADYNGTTKVVSVDREWRVSPDATSVYQITADNVFALVDQGTAQAGTATTITLRGYASAINDTYLCNIVAIIAGTGRGQARLVGSYVGATKVATICGDNWVTNPDATSVYVLLPYGTTCANCMGTTALTQISTEMDTNSTKMAPSQTLNDYKATGFSTHDAAAVKTAIEAGGSSLAQILADTNELQTDWVNGGRLDLILDIIAADTTTDIPALIAALNDISVANIIAGISDGALDLQEMLRIILAFCACKSSGGGTATIKFRDYGDAKDRITATVDITGNRTAITLDGS